MFRVRLIFAETSAIVPIRKDVQVADLDHAKHRARHELDLERYLAGQPEPLGAAPVAVQILKHGRVIWQLTEADRALERGQ